MLREFWAAFHAAIDGTKDLTITQVIDTLDASLGSHFFPSESETVGDPRICPSCGAGRLGLKLSRNGAFIGCSGYPNCRYTRPLAVAGGTGDDALEANEGPRLLGADPVTGMPVTVRRGPYGAYVQLGPMETTPPPPTPEPAPEPVKAKKKAKVVVEKPKRVSIPKGVPPADVDLDIGLRLLALPREVGAHPETNVTISAGIGRFGPYLKLGNVYKSLADDDDVLTIGINRAVILLGEEKQRSAATPGRVVGNHPADGKPITIGSGRFGPYAKHGSVYASLSRGSDPDEVTLEMAVQLVDAKAAKSGGTGKAAKGKSAAKKSPAPKAAAAKEPKAKATVKAAKESKTAETVTAPKPAKEPKAAKAVQVSKATETVTAPKPAKEPKAPKAAKESKLDSLAKSPTAKTKAANLETADTPPAKPRGRKTAS